MSYICFVILTISKKKIEPVVIITADEILINGFYDLGLKYGLLGKWLTSHNRFKK